jgi:2-succinyl-6-hydroxy-2,4-cyclohexadiene-1-carboxylate synthase
VTLAAIDVGAGRPIVTIVHGFTQVGGCMRDLAAAIGLPCRLVDAPFHGESADVDVDLWGAGRELAGAVDGGLLVAYSMGARLALHALLAVPSCASAAVLISGTPGIDDESARADRRRSDEALASRIERIGTPAFIDEWLAQPMFANAPRSDDDRALRCTNSPRALARSLRRLGQGAQEPLADRLGDVEIPVTAVAGSDDARYVAEAQRIAAGVRRGRAVVVEGSGHAVHAERPSAVAEIVVAALRGR